MREEEGTSAVTETEGGSTAGRCGVEKPSLRKPQRRPPPDEEPATCSAEGRAFQRERKGHK